MTRSRRGVAAAVAGTIGVVAMIAAYRAGRAHADDIPATPSMYYGVTLENAGVPVNESRILQVRFFSAATGGTMNCDSGARTLPVANGHVRVPLGSDCVAAVHTSSEQWAEVSVDGMVVGGRSRLGAVPYAVEAQRAAGLTTAAVQSVVPPGTVVAYAGATAPDGWLLCDGRAVPRPTYAPLFAAISSTYGNGDGSTTFNLPDFRGRFLRGADLGVGRDPGRTLGSVQADMVGRHGHSISDPGHGHEIHSYVPGSSTTAEAVQYVHNVLGPANTTGGAVLTNVTGISVNDSTGAETRPVNSAVNYLIKF